MELSKITTDREDATRRRYDDACGTAHGLELVGDRWALLVVRELLMGPRRFGDLRGDLPGVSANVLTQRLEALERSGVVYRRQLPPPSRVQVYELTEWGYEAEALIKELGRWAARSPDHDPGLPLSGVSLMISFRTMFDARRAGDLRVHVGFRIGQWSYLVTVADGRLTSERTEFGAADVVFTGGAAAVAAIVYGGQSIEAMVASGALAVDGDRALAARFAGCFVLPEKAH